MPAGPFPPPLTEREFLEALRQRDAALPPCPERFDPVLTAAHIEAWLGAPRRASERRERRRAIARLIVAILLAAAAVGAIDVWARCVD
jgi:hypothetical protein